MLQFLHNINEIKEDQADTARRVGRLGLCW